MALTAQEQALLDSLIQRQNEAPEPPKYSTLNDVVRYLVTTSDKFSANPDDRQLLLNVLDELDGIGKSASAETPA